MDNIVRLQTAMKLNLKKLVRKHAGMYTKICHMKFILWTIHQCEWLTRRSKLTKGCKKKVGSDDKNLADST